MSKEEKKPIARAVDNETRAEQPGTPLTELEEDLSLNCLRYFRGDWDLYLDYLTGPRVSDPQRRKQLPIVERLKERDRRTDFLTAILEDEVVAMAERLEFENLHRVWELCRLLDPAPAAGAKPSDDPAGPAFPADDPSSSVH
jgi:hypothetical protein